MNAKWIVIGDIITQFKAAFVMEIGKRIDMGHVANLV